MLSTLLNGKVQAVKVGFAKPPLGYFKEARVFQLLEVSSHTALSCPHILRKLLLPWKAGVVCPGVFEEHGVSELGAHTHLFVGQDKVRDLGEAVAGDRIGTHNLDVAGDLLQSAIDGFHTRLFRSIAQRAVCIRNYQQWISAPDDPLACPDGVRPKAGLASPASRGRGNWSRGRVR